MAAAVAIPEGFEVETPGIPEGFEVESAASPAIPEGFEIESEPTQAPLPDRVPRGGGPPIPRSTPTAEEAALVQQAAAEGKPVIMENGRPTIAERPAAPPLSAGDQFVQGVERGLGGAAMGVTEGVARLTGASETADALGKDLAAMSSVLPEQTTTGKVGTGVGGALALLSGGGLPGALSIAGTQAVAGGYDAAYAKALEEGKPEEEARTQAQKGAFKSALIAVPELAAYWLLGAGAAKIVSPLVKSASPLVKTATAAAASTAANVATSTGLHAIHGDPLFTPEGLAMDATFGFAHAVASGREASASETRVREMLKDAPLESLEIAAADPAFRKASPYRPELIDAEIASRKATATAAAAQTAAPERTPPAAPVTESPPAIDERVQSPLAETATTIAPEQVKPSVVLQRLSENQRGEEIVSELLKYEKAKPEPSPDEMKRWEDRLAEIREENALMEENASSKPSPQKLTAFHATPSDQPISEFDIGRSASQSKSLDAELGIFMAKTKSLAQYYKNLWTQGKGGSIGEYEVTLNRPYKTNKGLILDALREFPDLKTPREIREALMAEGFDGIVSTKGNEFVIFDPKAAKLKPSAQAADQTKPVAESPSAEGSSATGQARPAATDWKQKALPEELRTTPELAEALSAPKVESERAPMREKSFEEGGALGFGGGGKPVVKPVGVTPKGDTAFIRVEGALKRVGRGLFTEGVGDVLAKSKNKIGQLLSKQVRKHVDLEQEITGQLTAELDRATKGMSKGDVKKAIEELEPYIAAKENGRPLPAISKNAQSMLTAWENIAERTGLMSEAHDVQVFDPTTGGYRSMHRIGRSYIPRIFRPDVQKVLQDPRSNPNLFNDLAKAMAAHRGVTLEAAAAELRGVAGRFQASDFMGNMEMARTGQLPEVFYDYNLGNMAASYIPRFSERMAQIVSYGQRLGPREAPVRENLWDVAMREAEDSYTQQWLRSAEDQAVNLRAAGGPLKAAQQGQTIASGLLLSSPTTTVLRNMLSGLTSTTELLGVRRSMANLIKAATDMQTKLDAREMGVVRENLGDFLHADQLGETLWDQRIRKGVDKALKFSGYNASEGFVRTHAASTASQFAKDGVAAIAKNPASMAAKEALGLFKRMGVDAEKIVAEGADWKTGAETRKFVRTVIRESQGGYRFDQVPQWANSAPGRFFYQLGRWGTMRARNIFKNGIQPLLGEEVQWHGKTMARRDPRPLIKMGLSAVALGEAYALLSQGFFDRDRKDASVQEITAALEEDQKEGALLASERIINDIIMSGSLGIIGQPVDFAKSIKDQSRAKNPAEPPAMASTRATLQLAQDFIDQEGRVTSRDLLKFLGGITPGVKQLSDVARNVFDEPLYEAENDIRTLRTAATRWAAANKLDVPKKMVGDFRKSAKAPEYEEIRDALLVGDADRAKFLAEQFLGDAGDKGKARTALKASVKGRQPFRVGPFTSGEYRTEFMTWAEKNLPKEDFQQAKRVQDRYEAAARAAGLW